MSYMLSVCGLPSSPPPPLSPLTGNYNYLEFISNSKSGQFFFYSHDGGYMIKTQTNEENKFMKRILPHYYRYVTENPHTFLVRIYGMHRVKMYHLNRKVHFVIMGSVFDSPCQINTIYDLKGSLVGRSATPEERASAGVLKDNDLILDQNKLKLGSKRELFLSQIEKDSTFLSQLNIMDYSLLVCDIDSIPLPHTLVVRWGFIIAQADILKKSNLSPRLPLKIM
jgi:1-phosphatidylinositol-4-phosphate 5-kinase